MRVWETVRRQERDWRHLDLRERLALAGGMAIFWAGFLVFTLIHQSVGGVGFWLAFLAWFLLWIAGFSYLAVRVLARARRRRHALRRRL